MLKDVAGDQASLAADSFHPTALSGFRVQLHSIQERISSLQAGLRTWQDHLHRLQRLASECKEQEGRAAAVMDEQTKVVMAPLPDSAQAADTDFRLCEAALQRLDALTLELEALAAVQDELKEAVSPSDIKQTTQRAWLLWQRQADLRHQVALRMQELEGRSALLSLFRAQNFRFLEWTEVTTVKLDNVDASGLNMGLQADIVSKEQELRWLERAATQLEGEDKAEVEVAAAQSRKSYEEVTSLLKALLAKQRNSMNAQVALEDDLREFKLRLTQFEEHVKKPWNQGGTSEAEYLAASQVQATLDRELNQQSGRVSSLLNDGEVLLLSSPSTQLAFQLSEVEESWTSVCNLSSSRAQLLESTWGRWQQLLGPGGRLLAWLNNKNEEASIESNKIRLSDSIEKQKELDVILMEQKEKETSLQDLNSVYDNLAKEGGLDASGDLRVLHARINEAWKNLSCNTTTLIRTLTEVFAMFESLMKLKESEMTLLRQLDAEVTEVQVSSAMADEEKRRKLQIANRSIKERAANVQKAKKKMDAIKEMVHPEDKTILVQNHEELTALYEDVKTRILNLTEEFCVEAEKEKGKERQVIVTVHKAKKLEKRGFFGKGDHYVLLTIGDQEYRSETIDNNQDPEWQFKSTVKLNKGMPNKIKLEVFDEDIGKDDHVGQATIDISQDQLQETWIPLQGCKSGAVLVSITTDLKDPIKFEQNRGIQVDTLPPDSGFVSESSEFARRVVVCRANIAKLEQSLDITEDSELLHTELNDCRSSLEMCRVYLETDESKTVVAELGSLILLLEARINEKIGKDDTSISTGPAAPGLPLYSEVVRGSEEPPEAPGSPASSCPLCRRRNWNQVEGDMWRLEHWLEHSSATLSQLLRAGVPTSIEHLEEVIQDHREFLLQLDSHKSVAMSINVVGSHLAEHAASPSRAEAMESRLAAVNGQWDAVCEQATLWQTRLQTALLENGEFHATIQELLVWLDSTTAKVREAEPVDLRVDRATLEAKHSQLVELSRDLARCEPRVVSLQEAADQLELQADSPACRQVKRKLALLIRSLRGLRQVVGIYIANLARALGLPAETTTFDSELVLPVLTEQLDPMQGEASPATKPADSSDDNLNTGVLIRCHRLLGRVVRAAVPIQALMLLLLGVSSIVPLDQDELICSLQNNLQRSLEPMLQWSNGPPPL